jgi:hypothetical protein
MIGRVDDISHVKTDNITPHSQYDFILRGKMRWSKNVMEERDCPDQVIFGANNPKYCTILALAIHLEHALMRGELVPNTRSQSMFGVTKVRGCGS